MGLDGRGRGRGGEGSGGEDIDSGFIVTDELVSIPRGKEDRGREFRLEVEMRSWDAGAKAMQEQ